MKGDLCKSPVAILVSRNKESDYRQPKNYLKNISGQQILQATPYHDFDTECAMLDDGVAKSNGHDQHSYKQGSANVIEKRVYRNVGVTGGIKQENYQPENDKWQESSD